MTDKTEYEEVVEARARAIDPGGWAHEGTHSHDNLQLRQRRRTARGKAVATMAQDEARGYALVKREATEGMVPGNETLDPKLRRIAQEAMMEIVNVAIEARRVKENDG